MTAPTGGAPADQTDERVCYIRSTTDDNGNAACLMRWGAIEALLTPEVVLATAHDLAAAAVHAETDVALVDTLRQDVKLSDQVIAAMLQKVRQRRPIPRGKVALRIQVVAGVSTGKPFVTIARGSMKGQLSPDEARAMAVTWTRTATAAQIDVRLRYALGEWDRLSIVDIEELFDLIQKAQGPS